VFWFFAFKEGFVRQDAIHTGWFFGALVGGFVALRWRRERRAVGLGATAALVTCALAAQSASLGDVVSPSRNIRAALHDLRTVASSSRSKQIAAAGRAQIIAAASIDPRSMTELRGHTVAIYPLEIAVTWAYGLRWDPIPVEQSYSAYTTHLDDLDARFLRSANAPQRFLIGPPEADIEGRITSFDAPATSRAIVCNYAPLSTGTRYAVLAHRPNRCAVPRLMATVHAGWGQSVHVPGPPDAHSTVIARISGAGSGPVESLRALLWKPAPRFVSINGAAPVPFVTGTAEDGLPLRAAPGIDLPVPFNVFPQATTIAIFNAGAPLADGAPVTYRFYSQSVS
jgi:alpha/beta superfamily hydrolase